MKKLTICAVAVSGLFAAQANAGDVQLVGFVAPVCEVSGLYTQLLDFGQVSSIQSVSTDLSIQCNDADGATVTLTSAEGGLESDDKEDYAIGYTATLSPDSHADLVLTTLGGPGANDVSASMSYSGSLALAGGVPTSLSVTTNETMGWSGGYSDTLTVQVTAN
ncbi:MULTISPECIES: hypothetical protein [Vibrio]|uniref:Spore coat protein U domain-containing protein n=2 Tax=Vibrio TaxID=662 RepID=A0A1E5CWQ3_9VIBR|nr:MULTISPECIES: hypothetical protein [Vibrio]RBW64643.1 hypothetical protein DS893_13220 [Vibrionales bacterium C3R12]MDN3697136.1 hypothetical protein [Vibrio cortegadensis]NOH82305.1 hypothetical protein [Vibrio sp. 03-59-1]OEE74797.1 hypothetical protein A130_17580 [Vibrio genomosp. F6 str. FF-238]TKF21673.1 hypothetical protein FCV43_10110 [Vibrio genomosp. F6]